LEHDVPLVVSWSLTPIGVVTDPHDAALAGADSTKPAMTEATRTSNDRTGMRPS